MSYISRALPPPRATQVRGSSAIVTGIPVSSLSNLSKLWSNAPPPDNIIPCSAISAANSGGDFSRAVRTAATMPLIGSERASRISFEFKVNERGTPSTTDLPRTSFSCISCSAYAEPISILTCSAVDSPIS